MRSVNRCGLLSVLVLSLSGVGGIPPGASAAGALPYEPCTLPAIEAVIGIPGANHGTGAIEVVLHDQPPAVYEPGVGGLPAMPAGAHFGATAATAYLDGNVCPDLLVGAPDLAVNGMNGAGGLQELFDSASGFTAGPGIVQDGSPQLGSPSPDAHFGTSLQVDTPEISVGIPGAPVPGSGGEIVEQAGEVETFSVTDGVPDGSYHRVQTMPHPQAGAHFGATQIGDVIGAPDAGHGAKHGTGYVLINGVGHYGSTAGAALGSSAVYTAARGDDDVKVMVGAPGQTVKGKRAAGAVVAFTYNPDGDGKYSARGGTLSQASKDVPGKVAQNARFGASLASVILENLSDARGRAILAIGIPGASVGSKHGAGAVDVRFTDTPVKAHGAGISWLQKTMASARVPGEAGTSAHFGDAAYAVLTGTSGRTGMLYVGAPGTAKKAGAVERMSLSIHDKVGASASRLRRADGPVADDEFGASLITND
jgi:hypothetical protein